MAYGIRISKEGIDVNTPLTEDNKKDFIFLSDSNSPKVIFAGFLEGQGFFQEIRYEHNMGRVPMFFLYYVDSITNPTVYRQRKGAATTTEIFEVYIEYAYLIILEEGS